MSKFDDLVALKSGSGFVYQNDDARAVFAPDLGGRVFCELKGHLLHRLDIENVRKPDKPFNNYGGNNFWPAPEGGNFGFNYKGDQWYVQEAINDCPFVLESKAVNTAKAGKKTTLINRKGIDVDVVMERDFSIVSPSKLITDFKPAAALAYTVNDRIGVINQLNIDDALLACWTLEQFEASENSVCFAKVKNPKQAINFDFYENPPTEKIQYSDNGFFYKTDGKECAQIAITKNAQAEFIGFYDMEKKLLCLREIIGSQEGLYFNIADNNQPEGPFSAEDVYSIYNGNKEQGFFEVETIGGATVEGGLLKGATLLSMTSFAIFDSTEPLERFIRSIK